MNCRDISTIERERFPRRICHRSIPLPWHQPSTHLKITTGESLWNGLFHGPKGPAGAVLTGPPLSRLIDGHLPQLVLILKCHGSCASLISPVTSFLTTNLPSTSISWDSLAKNGNHIQVGIVFLTINDFPHQMPRANYFNQLIKTYWNQQSAHHDAKAFASICRAPSFFKCGPRPWRSAGALGWSWRIRNTNRIRHGSQVAMVTSTSSVSNSSQRWISPVAWDFSSKFLVLYNA